MVVPGGGGLFLMSEIPLYTRGKTRVRGLREGGAATEFALSEGCSAGPRVLIDGFDAPMESQCPYAHG